MLKGNIANTLNLIVFLLVGMATGAEAGFDHQVWDGLLQEHVRLIDEGRASQVDYQSMKADRDTLRNYLDALREVRQEQFYQWPQNDQLAFLINAYNAWMVELILSEYPDITSIKELGTLFQSPWKKKFIPLLGKTLSLDDIEHGLIRQPGQYDDPRIHFAVNCASVGCPALGSRAYGGATLDDQLDRATRLFLADTTRNRMEDGRLKVSSIFKWYRGDFEKGWRSTSTLGEFLALYADSLGLIPSQVAALVAGRVTVDFLDYDWRLNDLR